MPSPIPLVDPVTSATLSASGRAAAVCVLISTFMTGLRAERHGIAAASGANLLNGSAQMKCLLAKHSIRARYRRSA
jgi:hypothetical protein